MYEDKIRYAYKAIDGMYVRIPLPRSIKKPGVKLDFTGAKRSAAGVASSRSMLPLDKDPRKASARRFTGHGGLEKLGITVLLHAMFTWVVN